MLPAEAFADVLTYIKPFSMNSLLLANRTLSSRARQITDAIRVTDFSELSFTIRNQFLNVCRIGTDSESTRVYSEYIKNHNDIVINVLYIVVVRQRYQLAVVEF